MATGLEVGASIAGFISLSITAFNGCVKGFQLISSAQHIGGDADRIRCMLEYEQFRLMQWGNRVGLDIEGQSPSPTLNWTLIADFLKQLQLLLTDLDVLRARYNLVPDDNEVAKATEQADAKGKQGIGKLWTYVKPEIRTARARIIQDSAGPMKRLRWATIDQEKIKEFISQVGYFNNCLQELLETAEQHFVKSALSALLRDLISRTPGSADLDVIRALIDEDHVADGSSIDAAATLKQLRLFLKIDQRLDEKPPAKGSGSNSAQGGAYTRGKLPALPKLSYSALTLNNEEKLSITERRQLGVYKTTATAKRNLNSQVLIEWKPVEKAVEEKLSRRIFSLVYMLMDISNQSFHALKCLGFLKHERKEETSNMYAFIYEISNLYEEGDGPYPNPAVRPLNTLFTASPPPSLTFRFKLALSLAETIQQLHTSGWLHKGIRSENVLYIDRGYRTWAARDPLGPYVAGYEYARADNPLEMTEDTPTSPEHNLYRHSDSQGPARPSYKKAFDLFSLGCVLLEIAFWMGLPEILFHVENENAEASLAKMKLTANVNEKEHLKWDAILKGKQRLTDLDNCRGILDQVAFHAGDEYSEVVKLCFFPIEEKAEDDEEPEASLQTQTTIVQKLSSLVC